MQAFSCNNWKNGLLYAFIGLFTVGGVILGEAKKASAFYTAPSSVVTTKGFSINLEYQNGYPNPVGNVLSDSGGTATGTDLMIGDIFNIYNWSTVSPGTGSITYSCLLYSSVVSISTYVNGSMTFVPVVVPPDCDSIYNTFDGGITDTNTSTHFMTVYPATGTTTATTTIVGAKVRINSADTALAGSGYARLHVHMVQDSAFSCMNSGAVYDAVVTCAGPNAPAPPIDLDLSTTSLTRLISGDYNLSNLVTFGGGGLWDATYTIENVSYPWYELGLIPNYSVIISTTTQFTIGQLSPMDTVRQVVASSTSVINKIIQQGIGSVLSSTTATFASACTPVSISFNLGDCISLAFWPGQQAISDDFTILKELPPWGYAFRFIDILNAPLSTTTLPKVSYTLSTSSPFYPEMTDITFDPLGAIQQSGDFINSVKSDQATPMSLWQIVMPAVNVIIYLALGFMIIKDLTNIHKHDDGGGKHKDRNKNV